MFVVNPKIYLKDEDQYEPILQIQRSRNEMFLDGIDSQITQELIDEAHDELVNTIGIETVTKKALEIIFKLYPKVKIELLMWGASDTSCREILADTITDFYLKSEWPSRELNDEQQVIFFEVLNKEILKFEETFNEKIV